MEGQTYGPSKQGVESCSMGIKIGSMFCLLFLYIQGTKKRLATQLTHRHVGGQGMYLRLLDHLHGSILARDVRNIMSDPALMSKIFFRFVIFSNIYIFSYKGFSLTC